MHVPLGPDDTDHAVPGKTYGARTFPAAGNAFTLNTPANVVFVAIGDFVQARLTDSTDSPTRWRRTFSGGQLDANFKATTQFPVPSLPRAGMIALALLPLGVIVRRIRLPRLRCQARSE